MMARVIWWNLLERSFFYNFQTNVALLIGTTFTYIGNNIEDLLISLPLYYASACSPWAQVVQQIFFKHTHTIILRLFWILSRTTRVSRYQKGKTNLYLLEQEIVSGSGICWAICKSAPHADNHANIPPLCFFLQVGCPSWRPTNSVKALKARAQSNLLLPKGHVC